MEKHYAEKHAGNAEIVMDEKLKAHLMEKAGEKTIKCTEALLTAAEMGKTPQDVGVHLDLLEIRILECQLGLFGFSPVKRIVKRAGSIDPAIRQLIEGEMKNGCISCEFLLKIAEQNNILPVDVAGMCEALEVQIKPCQLGAF